ncbi:hypothetical protein CGJ20_21545 [Vibrio parahaemolyticus]|uniref:hypothetical protein n=1 Tax=Vibrio parahaemolyticus TaxID=670 RepID=UPI00111E1E9E|nr:hypothetical protein [Vibrio parahaemolyticus]TOF55041.1 hypothetical protein CGJ20_21545 [Vibrio parahaemolyticus]
MELWIWFMGLLTVIASVGGTFLYTKRIYEKSHSEWRIGTMDKQKARYRVVVQYLETGDAFIELPNDLLKQVDLGEGDELEWKALENGSFELGKITKLED